MNTAITYMYRDASNYKQFNTVIFSGILTPEQTDELLSYLENGEDFVVTQIGLEPLQKRMIGFPSGDDHGWHEIDEIKDVDNEPTDSRSILEFLKQLSEIKEWGPVKECEELGIPV